MKSIDVDEESLEKSRRSRLISGFLLFTAALVSLSSLLLATRLGSSPEGDAGAAADSAPVATAVSGADGDQGAAQFPGRLVFVDERGQIGTVSPAGADARQLTSGSRVFLFPAWSPAGSRIAAIGAERGGAGIFTFADEEDADSEQLYFDGERPPIYLYWSPDGDRVSFIAQYDDEDLGLFLAPDEASAESRLLASGQPMYWDWADGGREVLVHSGSSGPQARLALVTVVEDEDEEAQENLATPGFFQAPSFSRAGQYMAYAEVDERESRWLVVEEAATGETQRAPHTGAVAFGWSPTQEQVAFISPEPLADEPQFSFYGPLRLMDAASGEVRVLSVEPTLAFFWSPDGETIAYLTLTEGSGEQIANAADGLTPVNLAQRPLQQEDLHFTLWVVYVRSGQVRRLIDFRPTRLFVTQFLPFFDQYALSHHLWSPDSTALVLPVVEEQDAQIMVISRDGERVEVVAEGQVAFWSPR